MSHFTVLVIGPNPEAQLKPYDQDILVEPYPKEVNNYTIAGALEQLKEKNPERTWTAADGTPIDDFTLRQIVDELNADPDDDDQHLLHEGKVCYMSRYNPDSKWDWYQVGGRWRGYFPLKEGVEWDRKMLGEAGLGGSDADVAQFRRDRMVDIVTVGNVDFTRARDAAEKGAREGFAKWRPIFEEHGRPRGWAETVEMIQAEVAELKKKGLQPDEIIGERTHPGLGELSPPRTYKISREGEIRERLRAEYRAQPAIAKAWEALHMFECPVDWAGFDEDAYAKRVRASALVPYALVKDGRWYAKGELGWWAVSRNEKDDDKWVEEVSRLFDDLPPETLLTLYDCHI